MGRTMKTTSVLLVLLLLMSVLSACSPTQTVEEPTQPIETPENGPTEDPAQEAGQDSEISREAVLREEGFFYLNNIPEETYIIDPVEALELIEKNPDEVLWVDVRAAEDYEKGHIPGAVNIPFARTGEMLDKIPLDRKVIFQCYSGQTSAMVKTIALMNGVDAVSFGGGWNFGWVPLERGEDTLETSANELPDYTRPELDEREKIIMEESVKFFSTGSNYIIAPVDLLEYMEEIPDAITLVDIRSTEHFEEGHLEGAIHIPLGCCYHTDGKVEAYSDQGEKINEIPTNRPVYIICYRGETSGMAAAALRIMGYNAHSLNRGMIRWDSEERPKVTE